MFDKQVKDEFCLKSRDVNGLQWKHIGSFIKTIKVSVNSPEDIRREKI